MNRRLLLCILCVFPLWLQAQLTIVLEQLPVNTPHDATLFLVGDFNDWNPGDPTYLFKFDEYGTRYVVLPQPPDSFEYKITRGNWASVEGRSNGRHRPNRRWIKQEQPETIYIQIQSWEDLEGGLINFYTFLLLLSAFQGILLIFAINGIQDNNVSANRILSLLIFMISFALLGRVSIYDRDIYIWGPWLKRIPELIFFVYGPVFYLYLRTLLKLEEGNWRQNLAYFVPALIHFIAILPSFFWHEESLTHLSQRMDLSTRFWGILALCFNLWLLYRSWNLLSHYAENSSNTHSFQQNLHYLHVVLLLQAICLGLWASIGLVWLVEWLSAVAFTWVSDLATDMVWGWFSLLTYILGYFAMNQPEIFKLHKVVPKYKDSSLTDEEMERYKKRLIQTMEEEQTYSNPELTLGQLAEIVRTNTHTLSRVINEGYGKSFYDFINEYRVEAFNELLLSEASANETFLAIAFQVGFNSKTTFNRAYKKVTGTTPRSFLREQTLKKEKEFYPSA